MKTVGTRYMSIAKKNVSMVARVTTTNTSSSTKIHENYELRLKKRDEKHGNGTHRNTAKCRFRRLNWLQSENKELHKLKFVFVFLLIQGQIHVLCTWTVPLPAKCKIHSILFFSFNFLVVASIYRFFFLFIVLPPSHSSSLFEMVGFDTLIKITPNPNQIQWIVNWLDSSSIHTHARTRTHNSEIWFEFRTIERNYVHIFDNNPFWSMHKANK